MGTKREVLVGVDVSKKQLDVSVRENRFVVANDPDGWARLVRHVSKYTIRVVVIEATGGYEADLAIALSENEIPIAVVNPRQVRHFAKAKGSSAKTDKIDSRILAEFGQAMDVQPQILPDAEQTYLKELVDRRRSVNRMLVGETNRLAESWVVCRPRKSPSLAAEDMLSSGRVSIPYVREAVRHELPRPSTTCRKAD